MPYLRLCFILICLTVCRVGLSAGSVVTSWHYTVKPGDNLINIAKKHLLNPADWKRVQQINNIKNPYRLPTGYVLKVPLTLVRHQPVSAEVVAISGLATLQKNGVITPLSRAQKLMVGDVVNTGASSSLSIRFADGSVSTLGSNTTVMLDTMSLFSGGAMVDTQLRLQQGQLEIQANPNAHQGNRMQIITPSAIAAVRGTEFRVNAVANAVTQETLTGLVDFAAASQTVHVEKGFGTLAEVGQPPIPPVPLLPAVDTQNMPEMLNRLPIEFVLPRMEGVSSWLGRVSQAGGGMQLRAEREISGNHLVFDGLEDGEYFLSLRAKDRHGIAGFDAIHTFVLNAQPFAPQLVFPTSVDLLRNAEAELVWKPSKDAHAYTVQLAQSPTFDVLLLNQRLQTTRQALPDQLSTGRYYWRVAAITQKEQQIDQGPFTEAMPFDYRPMPPTPNIDSLQVRVVNNRVLVNMEPPMKGMQYQLRLANPAHQQQEVWTGLSNDGVFEFALREFGAQQLFIQHLDEFGVASPAALFEFMALPQ